MLPDSYTETGEATRMVINCHGAGGAISAYDSMIKKTALSRYLVANGYAVTDYLKSPLERYADLKRMNAVNLFMMKRR